MGRTLTQFRDNFMQPKKIDRRTGRVYGYEPRPGARERIYAALSDTCLSMPPGEWESKIGLRYNRIYVDLPPAAMAVYRELEREYIALLDGGEVVEAATAAALGNKLMQVCNGTVYDENRSPVPLHSAKLDALQELVEVTEGQVLLAYWYQHDRDRIAERFKGKTLLLSEDEQFERKWNEGQVGLGMVQPASGGHGLNLQDGGSIACWFGPIYNLELYLQFNKRLHRPGQKAGEVVIHHIMARDTIEDDILDVNIAGKHEDQEALLEALRRRVDRVRNG